MNLNAVLHDFGASYAGGTGRIKKSMHRPNTFSAGTLDVRNLICFETAVSKQNEKCGEEKEI